MKCKPGYSRDPREEQHCIFVNPIAEANRPIPLYTVLNFVLTFLEIQNLISTFRWKFSNGAMLPSYGWNWRQLK